VQEEVISLEGNIKENKWITNVRKVKGIKKEEPKGKGGKSRRRLVEKRTEYF
jgi:hypothetical protein